MKNNNLFFYLCITLVVAIFAALLVKGSSFLPGEFLTGLEMNGKGLVTMRISPGGIDLVGGQGKVLDVLVDSKGEKITVSEIQLSFDPKVIHIEDISPGTFFKEPVVLQKEIQNGGGKAVFVIGGKEGVLGSGKIAQMKITGVGKGSSALIFTGMTKVAAVDKVDNVLGKARGILVKVQ